MGRLKLADPLNACTYLKTSEEDVNDQFIYVAKRGDCTFVVKSHYAQLAGAKLLIIVDNKLEDVDQRLMVDDGNLGTIFQLWS
jgi:PA domain